MSAKGKTAKPRIAYFAGSNATIHSIPPLVTSNKARAKYGLAPLTDPDQSPARFDVLRPQRLARPAIVYVEQFSAHPLEADAAELYGPPDGYLDPQGNFHKERTGPADKPVYEVELRPDDGLYPLPYMARQAGGGAWDADGTQTIATASQSRQPFFPDGSRPVEEIDRLSVGEHGTGNLISAYAEIDFFRVMPPSGYTKGLPADRRTDIGEGDVAPETLGKDFFPYRPPHLGQHPPRLGLARIVNAVQAALSTGKYAGAIWTQGSPRIEETLYWLNLLLDTTLPLCGNSAQRAHGMISNDGPKNLVDSVDFITSRVWADEAGKNRTGLVLIQEQQIFAAREVQKGDARPGGYVATGGHGGILGGIGFGGNAVINYVPATRHTHRSDVNISRLPPEVIGVRRADDARLQPLKVAIKHAKGALLDSAIPKVSIIKDGNYAADDFDSGIESQVDVLALLDLKLRRAPLAGFVLEGLSPYGTTTSRARHQVLLRAVCSGMPVARVGRGNNEGFTQAVDLFIGGSNLTSTKARLLLMACLMRFGSLPPAADPDRPTKAELDAIRLKLAAYQAVFDTH
jgi:L-asparaginase